MISLGGLLSAGTQGYNAIQQGQRDRYAQEQAASEAARLREIEQEKLEREREKDARDRQKHALELAMERLSLGDAIRRSEMIQAGDINPFHHPISGALPFDRYLGDRGQTHDQDVARAGNMESARVAARGAGSSVGDAGDALDLPTGEQRLRNYARTLVRDFVSSQLPADPRELVADGLDVDGSAAEAFQQFSITNRNDPRVVDLLEKGIINPASFKSAINETVRGAHPQIPQASSGRPSLRDGGPPTGGMVGDTIPQPGVPAPEGPTLDQLVPAPEAFYESLGAAFEAGATPEEILDSFPENLRPFILELLEPGGG